MKNNRAVSFVIMTAIYLLATALGVVTFNLHSTVFWLSLLIADVVCTLFVFIFSCILGNASVYDPYWSVQPPIILFAFAIVKGFGVSAVVIICAVTLWAVRLTANWAYTFKNLNSQDWRYTLICEKTGKIYPLVNFVGIHLVPTLVVYLCTLPAVIVIENQAEFVWYSLLPVALCVVAVALQLISDWQMQKYRKTRPTPFIRTGLWKNSRHPNYLGEILMWWGVGLYAFCLIPKWYMLVGAICNTALFFFVSIPLAEQRQSKKDGFEQYKKETHVLLPFPKKVK